MPSCFRVNYRHRFFYIGVNISNHCFQIPKLPVKYFLIFSKIFVPFNCESRNIKRISVHADEINKLTCFLDIYCGITIRTSPSCRPQIFHQRKKPENQIKCDQMIGVVCSNCIIKNSHLFGILVFAEKLPVVKCLAAFFVKRIKIPMFRFFIPEFIEFRRMVQSTFIFIKNIIFPAFLGFYVPGFCDIFIAAVFVFKPFIPVFSITFIAY